MTASNYQPPEHQDQSWMRWVFWLGVIMALLLGNLFLVSCSPRIIEHIQVQRDTLYQVRVDSVLDWRRDSVFVREKGDTIFQYVEKVRYRERWHYDTIRVVKVDSVAVERVKEVQVEKPLSWIQTAKIRGFWPLLIAVLVLLVWTFRKWIFRFV